MRIECLKEKLRNALAQAERASGKNLSLPVLSSVVLEASNQGVRVKATNLDLGVEIVVPAKVTGEGSVAIPGGLLCNYLSILRGGDAIVLEKSNENLTVSSDTTNTLIKTQSTEDFPDIPRVEVENLYTVDARRFVDGIKNVLYSAALTDIKPEIASIYIYTANDELVFVATDSFRLAEKRTRLAGVESQKGFLLPHKNALEVVRILGERTGDLEVGYGINQVAFLMEGLYLTSRLVGGSFPPYEQIIPQEPTTTAVVLKKDIIDALKLTTLFTDRFSRISLKVLPKEGLFEIESRNNETGENTVRIDATLEGGDTVHAFSAKLILDCFQSIPEDSVTFSFFGESKPLVIKPVGDASFRYLVMPMMR
ncbi:MAG: DNA polymerase III subunit beta [bacterium]|nr:DNA polymerase III subunit beta [bacterium]